MPDWVAEYIGIPFLEHGRDRGGCDCWGLARLVWAERAGVAVPDAGTQYPGFDADRIGQALRDGRAAGDWRIVEAGCERPFDAVLMKGYVPGEGGYRAVEMHVGVVVVPGKLLHVERGTDALLADYRRDRRVDRRVVGFWRHRELVEVAP
ncbi:MAG: peptidoglycan endopeptidase [Alphaproteobacteria bacterium]